MWKSPLILVDLSLPTLAENLALDEALLTETEATSGPPLLRFWECLETAVALGRSSRVAEHVDVDACRRDGVPIVRRSSGGGVVLLGPGCLAMSLILPAEHDGHRIGLQLATRTILARTTDAIRDRAPRIEQAGTSDLAIEGRKVSGNAQRWLARMFLHHGTFLCDFPIARISRYLLIPPDQPAYRAGRSHADFLANLTVEPAELKRRIATAWSAARADIALPFDAAHHLVREKYASDEWNLRR